MVFGEKMKISKNKIRRLIIEALEAAEEESLKKAKDDDERKKIYKKLLLKYHTDRGNEEEKEFRDETTKSLNALYDELTNSRGNQRNQQYSHPDDGVSSGSWDSAYWDTNPKMPGEFSDEELKEKIKDAKLIEGAYGFSELYVEFLRREHQKSDRMAQLRAKKALERFNQVNTTARWTVEISDRINKPISNIEYDSNNLANYKVVFGKGRGQSVSFSCIYRSLRMLKEVNIILSEEGIGGIEKAFNAYQIAARYSPLKTTASGRKTIKESLEAFEQIKDRLNNFIKRGQYRVLGLSHPKAKEMNMLINDVSSLSSAEGIRQSLYHTIFTKSGRKRK